MLSQENYNIAKYENRIFNDGSQEMRRSGYNVIQKITSLRGFNESYDKVLEHCDVVANAVTDYLDQMNDSVKDEKIITLASFDFIGTQSSDSSLPDYLSTVAGLMESLNPMRALGLFPSMSAAYADAIGYKITNTMSEYIIRKIDSDIKTDNLDAFDALEMTLKSLLKTRYFTFNRYVLTRKADTSSPEAKDLAQENYLDELDIIVDTVMSDLISQGQSIVDPRGVEEFKTELNQIDPALESITNDDVAYSPEYILSPEYYSVMMETFHKPFMELKANGGTEEELTTLRLNATKAHNAWNNLRVLNQAPDLQADSVLPGQEAKQSLNSISYPVALYQMLLYASKELFNKEYNENHEILSYIIDVVKEATEMCLTDDMVVYDNRFPYKWLSTFHIAHNADLSVWFSLADTSLVQAISTVDQILKGVTPEEAREEAMRRLEEMRKQGEDA